MKLHEDKFAFLNIINLIHEDSSIRADILEKDYYVTLLLRELAGKQVTLPAYFKGGTALYKAQKSIRRFSEDIDLTVCIDNCSNSQAKKRLEMAQRNIRPCHAHPERISKMIGKVVSQLSMITLHLQALTRMIRSNGLDMSKQKVHLLLLASLLHHLKLNRYFTPMPPKNSEIFFGHNMMLSLL